MPAHYWFALRTKVCISLQTTPQSRGMLEGYCKLYDALLANLAVYHHCLAESVMLPTFDILNPPEDKT